MLSKHPPDAYHTLDHHQNVFQNVLDVVNNENLIFDTDILEIATWWHDVFKGRKDEERLLLAEFEKLGFTKKEIKKILRIIINHSFGSKQLGIEEKLLYDADKIELVSIERWRAAFDMFDKGKISKKVRDKYIPEWNRRMPLLKGNLHLDYSNKLFIQKHQEFIRWIKSIGRYESGLFV